MLSYFRYISIISFLLVLAAAFFAGGYFRKLAVESVLEKPAITEAQISSDYFKKKIWCPYGKVFANLSTQAVGDWKSDPLFQRFEKTSQLLLETLPATKVSLLDTAGNTLFSTNNLDMISFENTGPQNKLLKEALRNGAAGRVISSFGYHDEAGALHKGTFVQVDVGFHSNACDPAIKDAPDMVIRFYYDKTSAIESLHVFQIAVTAGIILTFVVLYLALFFTSRRAESIINKQHDENLLLAQAKAQAETQNKEKSMFLANVSHELRTPLNAIIGFSEIIRDEVMGPVGNQQYKEYISDINTSGVHLLSLINDILDYSKAEARKLEVDCIDVDLSKTAHSCLRLVEPRAKDAKVKLIENIPNKTVIIQADAKRMKQVILNLLSNAVKFTPENGEVQLTIKEDMLAEKVQIIVRDTGIGIAPKDVSKALAPFGQVDSALSRRYEGTGLGLPLTKKLTEIMHGNFDLQSEEGLGTTITLSFPMNQPKAQNNPEAKKQF